MKRTMLRIALIFFIAAIIAGYFLYQSATAATRLSSSNACMGHIAPGQPDRPMCEVVWIPGVYK